MGRTLNAVVAALPKDRQQRIEARFRELTSEVESPHEPLRLERLGDLTGETVVAVRTSRSKAPRLAPPKHEGAG